MKLVTIILADSATVVPDGKVLVVGGGINVVSVPGFPATLARLSVVVRIEFELSECGAAHELHVTIREPDGKDLIPPQVVKMRPQRALEAEYDLVALNFVVDVQDLRVPRPGRYRVVAAAGKGISTLSSDFVVCGPNDAFADELHAGYVAFEDGEPDTSLRIFKSLIERYPSQPDGFNNLGFVQLAVGAFSDAVTNFERAEALGFDRPELLAVNQACAAYMAGRHVQALTCLQRITDLVRLGGAAVLYGLDGQSIFPVDLESQQDFDELVALDSAWAALAVKDRNLASKYLDRLGASSNPRIRAAADRARDACSMP